MPNFRINKLLDPIQIVNIPSGLVPKGAYNASTDYAVGDSVDYNGSSYVMFADAAAGTLPTDTTKWQILAEKGDTGSAGTDGTDGEGVPTGGTTGQVLTKSSSTDFDTTWSDPTAGTGAVDSVNGATGIVVLDADDIDDTSTTNKFVTATDITNLGNLSGINTGDQTTITGNAGTATKLATARNIDGQSFDGSANITIIAPGTHAATSKTTPVDADELPIVDSAASNVLKKLTWTNLKATLKTYFDTLYQAAGTYLGSLVDDTTPQLGGDLDLNTHTVGDATAADLTKLNSVTASASELNILDGATLSTTELNYVDGVTSAIQTQLDAKVDGTTKITVSSTEPTSPATGEIWIDTT